MHDRSHTPWSSRNWDEQKTATTSNKKTWLKATTTTYSNRKIELKQQEQTSENSISSTNPYRTCDILWYYKYIRVAVAKVLRKWQTKPPSIEPWQFLLVLGDIAGCFQQEETNWYVTQSFWNTVFLCSSGATWNTKSLYISYSKTWPKTSTKKEPSRGPVAAWMCTSWDNWSMMGMQLPVCKRLLGSKIDWLMCTWEISSSQQWKSKELYKKQLACQWHVSWLHIGCSKLLSNGSLKMINDLRDSFTNIRICHTSHWFNNFTLFQCCSNKEKQKASWSMPHLQVADPTFWWASLRATSTEGWLYTMYRAHICNIM